MAYNNKLDNISEQILKIKNMRRPVKKEEIVSYLKEYKTAMKELNDSYAAIQADIDPKYKERIERLKNLKNISKSSIKEVSNKKYNYHKIFNDPYYPIITGFGSNLNDKYFPLLYNSTISPLFNDNNVYTKTNSDGSKTYGNIFIYLSGNNHDHDDIAGDFEIADQWARYCGLFSGDRPEGYVWHHVFMGWFVSSITDSDGISIDNFLKEWRTPIYPYSAQYVFESTQPFYYYYKEISKISTLDASNWINCLSTADYNQFWIPDFDLSLMQLVKKELILGSEYLDSTDQYVIYKDNTEGGYQGDYTENDRERFRS